MDELDRLDLKTLENKAIELALQIEDLEEEVARFEAQLLGLDTQNDADAALVPGSIKVVVNPH